MFIFMFTHHTQNTRIITSHNNHNHDHRYKLVDKIGITLGLAEGRFTTVWKGKDLTNNRDVILKVCV